MIYIFSLIAIVQIVLWIYFIVNRRFGVLITTGLLSGFSIVSYLNAYYKYILNDPCLGSDGCFNETGIIFLLLTALLLLSTLFSLATFIKDRICIKTNHDII